MKARTQGKRRGWEGPPGVGREGEKRRAGKGRAWGGGHRTAELREDRLPPSPAPPEDTPSLAVWEEQFRARLGWSGVDAAAGWVSDPEGGIGRLSLGTIPLAKLRYWYLMYSSLLLN